MSYLRPKILDGMLEEVLAQNALVGSKDPVSGKYHHIGRFSAAVEGLKAKLTLFIGRDVETKRKFLIHLHAPLTRRNSRNVKDMYLVIPVEKLQLKPNVIKARDIPRITTEHLKKDGLQSADDVLCVSMELGCAAYAVMPKLSREMDTALEALPSQLLLHWRMLANRKSLDVYLLDPSAIECIRTINMSIQAGWLATPKLDLSHMYQGCHGAVNNWEQYPCNESTQQNATWNPFLDNDPPPYDAACSRPPPTSPSRAKQLLLDRCDSEDETSSKRTELIWRNTPQPITEAHLLKDADHLARPRKRKATEALTECSDRPVKIISRTVFQGIIPGSPTEVDSTQELAIASNSSHHEDKPVAEPQRWPSRTIEAEEAIRMSLVRRGNADSVSTRLDCSLLKEPHRFLEMQEWILKMWDFDPLAHDVYRNELLQLGLNTRRNRVGSFDKTKAELQRSFFKRCSNRLTIRKSRPSNLRHDADQLQIWLEGRICRNAVTVLADTLMDLHNAAAKVEIANAVEESDIEAFYEQKAECCAIAFVTFGGRVERN